ncbi:TonB family protein [Mucilaginibacter sabulilitoris]|uniref:TonB family protein n=1 Tax=Mucilaginibacter sabulilitoris TaxID=1173583 RepID=A0ABZ0TS13_9SPHI|nr:TonB family protein [Mucilaginibacter sabulilitoris]WPU93940.1 TonB family protein [Mucilaginibacter sabulilitoris]
MSWWQYLLLVNIYLVLFYGFYVLLLRKETFFQLNRVYLVAASLLSFFIPLIQVEWVRNLFITQQVKYTIYSSPVMIYHFKPIEATQISIGQVFTVLYGIGILFLSIRLMWQLIRLRKVIRQPKSSTAYSFFKKIRLNEENDVNPVIIAHEQVHVQQWHSADVMLIELVMIINWFNPVVYLYRFAIKHIHEYIADRQAVQAGTSKVDYALLLLSQTFNAPAHQLVNPFFNRSLLRQRIMMLQKNKSQRISLIKYGLSAPLFILMLILSSATINNSKPVTVINSKAHQLFTISAEPAALNDVFNDNDKPEETDNAVVTTTDEKPSKVFSSVDEVPGFPGGLNAFGRFLGTNIRYPKKALDEGLQGRVIVTFFVEKDGSLSGFKVLRGISDDIDAESIRVLKLSPKWKPGKVNNKAVRVQYSVPINFSLANEASKPDTNKSAPVFTSVEQVPEFPGGQEAFSRFLATNIRYPQAERLKGIQGRVIATFIVEADGSLSDLKITRGLSSGLDDESLRVLSLSPKWKPGVQNGRTVRVHYSVPISFILNYDKPGKPAEESTGNAETIKGKSERILVTHSITEDTDKIIDKSPKIAFGRSLTSAEPLYLLDDKVVRRVDMGLLDANNIESINVIKGSSATAIYGNSGRNGVILIKSKGKK